MPSSPYNSASISPLSGPGVSTIFSISIRNAATAWGRSSSLARAAVSGETFFA
ncbi:hypothetical protein [Brucella sp. 09RB8910]|uniref:hypothetical protein n=1 Tax=Brucella sp. 09RB8910 TaxID=1844051 RepID=UPI001FFCFD4B|nr:hypothetical protein [Brucella sp. 09RB8910]